MSQALWPVVFEIARAFTVLTNVSRNLPAKNSQWHTVAMYVV